MAADERFDTRSPGSLYRSQHQWTTLLPLDRVLSAGKSGGYSAERPNST